MSQTDSTWNEILRGLKKSEHKIFCDFLQVPRSFDERTLRACLSQSAHNLILTLRGIPTEEQLYKMWRTSIPEKFAADQFLEAFNRVFHNSCTSQAVALQISTTFNDSSFDRLKDLFFSATHTYFDPSTEYCALNLLQQLRCHCLSRIDMAVDFEKIVLDLRTLELSSWRGLANLLQHSFVIRGARPGEILREALETYALFLYGRSSHVAYKGLYNAYEYVIKTPVVANNEFTQWIKSFASNYLQETKLPSKPLSPRIPTYLDEVAVERDVDGFILKSFERFDADRWIQLGQRPIPDLREHLSRTSRLDQKVEQGVKFVRVVLLDGDTLFKNMRHKQPLGFSDKDRQLMTEFLSRNLPYFAYTIDSLNKILSRRLDEMVLSEVLEAGNNLAVLLFREMNVLSERHYPEQMLFGSLQDEVHRVSEVYLVYDDDLNMRVPSLSLLANF